MKSTIIPVPRLPAILLILFQILQRTTTLQIEDEAIWKIAELMAYAMFANLFLFGAQVFKEVYSKTAHVIYFRYPFMGIEHHRALVPYAWASIVCSVVAFVFLFVPATRRIGPARGARAGGCAAISVRVTRASLATGKDHQ